MFRYTFNTKTLLIVILVLCSFNAISQNTISGVVLDKTTNETLIGASVIVVNENRGTSTDFDGAFQIEYNSLPLKLEISYIGYEKNEIEIDQNTPNTITIQLLPDKVVLDLIQVTDTRLTKKLKESPLTVEAMDVTAIIEAPSSTFYESIGNLKGVDLTSASLAFKIINTRGFNSTSPVRSLQIIDGVDNQSPGLNFSLGNFLGTTELDTKGVEIIVGANSALYGPNAFNGVINMSTKDPFMFPGVSYQIKMGERSLIENCFRYAGNTKLKNDIQIGFKLNLQHMKANDWEANNMNAAYDSPSSQSNHGGYDAVNRYGDEWYQEYAFSQNKPGLGTVHRTGYLDSDLVDYNTKNFKFNTALHLKKNQNEWIYSFNYGSGTTIYHGDNRISLKNIQFLQNRIEFKRNDNFFIRFYTTHEDAGNSYDAVATAAEILDQGLNNKDWMKEYSFHWGTEIRDLMIANEEWEYIAYDDWDGDLVGWETYINNLFEQHPDILAYYHELAREFADEQISDATLASFIETGSEEFDSLFNHITSQTRFDEYGEYTGGTKFYDKSSLYHLQTEKTIKTDYGNFKIGGSGRLYKPDSNGSIFNDGYESEIIYEMDENGDTIFQESGIPVFDPVTGLTTIEITYKPIPIDTIYHKLTIQNYEFGIYLGYDKKILNDKLLINTTFRLDKNQNFKYLFSPAASLVYTPNKRDVFRVSFSSAIRNPTLTDQYFDYNQGIANLKGNLNGFGYDEYFITIDALKDYLAGDFKNPDALLGNFIRVDPIQPEQVQTFEAGFRTTFFNKLYVDASYYYSRYKNFIGYQIGATYTDNTYASGQVPIELEDVLEGAATIQQFLTGDSIDNYRSISESSIEIYRVAANAKDKVTSQGFSIGFNYYLNEKIVINGNYSWNKLINEETNNYTAPPYNIDEGEWNNLLINEKVADPIIPAYNTPEHKFNIGISNSFVIAKNEYNLSINYRWQEEFLFEGSPQFTGVIPSYSLVDAQINRYFTVKNSQLLLKIGASNILNNKIYQAYGGPTIGRLGYISLTFNY